MTHRASIPWLLVAVAVFLGLASVYLSQFRDALLRIGALYGGLLLHLRSFGGAAYDPPPTVIDAIRNVTYVGSSTSLSPSWGEGVEHFHNIFYAQDTSGGNRFAPPVAVVPARGAVVDATRPGAWCPQGTGDVLPFTSRVANVSENCLSLWIARSRGTKAAAGLPVMIWVYGGSYDPVS